MRTVARTAVVAGTATAVSNRVSRRQGEKWSEQEEAAYQQQQAEAAAAAPPPAADDGTDDMLAQLKELGGLRDAGILTDAEFEAQKAKILAG